MRDELRIRVESKVTEARLARDSVATGTPEDESIKDMRDWAQSAINDLKADLEGPEHQRHQGAMEYQRVAEYRELEGWIENIAQEFGISQEEL